MNQEIISVRRLSPESKKILWTGQITHYGESWAALPREVSSNAEGIESIVFEVVRAQDILRPHSTVLWTRSFRLGTLVLTFFPGLAVLFYGLGLQWSPNWVVGGLAFLGILVLHAAVNLLNDVQDHLKLIDLPGTVSGSGVLQRGWVSAKFLNQLGMSLLGLGILLGTPAVLHSPGLLAGIALIGVLGVSGYSNKPFSLKYKAFGEISIFLLLGPLLFVGYSLAFFNQVNWVLFAMGCFSGLLAWAIYLSDHISHILRDERIGIKTLASRLGFQKARRLLIALYFCAGLTLVLTNLFQGISVYCVGLVCLSAVPFYTLLRKLTRASGPSSALLGDSKRLALNVYIYGMSLFSLGLCLKLFFS